MSQNDPTGTGGLVGYFVLFGRESAVSYPKNFDGSANPNAMVYNPSLFPDGREWVEKKKPGGNYGRGTEGSEQPYDRASVNGPGPYFTFSAPMKDADGRTVNLPCQRPPWSQLIAVNANTGEIAWRTTLGINEALPPGRQSVGGSGSAGPAVTAGGLVFVGATNDRRFRAFDAKSGRELWTVKMDNTVNANPIVYQGRNGKQYVAVVATDTVAAFALPQ